MISRGKSSFFVFAVFFFCFVILTEGKNLMIGMLFQINQPVGSIKSCSLSSLIFLVALATAC
jgi:hypothetical protein